MKILYHHRIASKDGQFVHIDAITSSFEKAGHELVMVEPSLRKVEFGSESGAIAKFRSLLPGHLYELIEFLYCFIDFFKLISALFKKKPDCIYERYNLFLPSGIWAKKLFNIPLILEVNAPLYDERSKHSGLHLKNLAKWTEQYTWRNADHVLPVTSVLSDHLLINGVAKSRVTVLHNGIDPTQFYHRPKSAKIVEKYELQGKIVLGFVGFIREWHGLENVLSIMGKQISQNWHFLIVGDGPARDGLEQKALSCNLSNSLSITGLVQREQIADYLSVIDIALQPDVVEYASPLKMFEYMAMGSAILSIDRPNIREILCPDHSALLYQSDNKQEFEEKLLRLYNSSELRDNLSRNARERIFTGEFLWDKNAEKIIDIMQQLCRKH